MKNCYTILEVSSTASAEVIKASGKALSARYHPDRKDTGDAEKFKEVRAALDTLLDPQKRAFHDYQLGHTNGNGHGQTRGQQQYQQAQEINGQPGRMAWRNGLGWVFVPDAAGPFPSDRPLKQPQPYPDAYPPNIQQMAEEAAADIAYDLVDRILENMFRGRRR